MMVSLYARIMVGLTGHSVDKSTHSKDLGGLVLVGSTVCFAALLATAQFAVAGWFMGAALGEGLQVVCAIFFGIVGGLIVLAIDRSFIYAQDVNSSTHKLLSPFYLGLRVGLILIISTLNSQFTLPLLLKSELAIHVDDLVNQRYDQAKQQFTGKHELKDRQSELKLYESKVSQLKASLKDEPKFLIQQRNQAEQCMAEYRRKINQSIGPDIDETEVANLYLRDKIECQRFELAYKTNYKAYFAPRLVELNIAQDSLRGIRDSASKAQKAYSEDLQRADRNNNQFLNIASSDVLWSLITSNPGARTKYILVTVAQLVLELMPLLLKGLLGQSPLGARIAHHNHSRVNQLKEDFYRTEIDKTRLQGELDEAKIQKQVNYYKKLQELEKERNSYRDLKDGFLSKVMGGFSRFADGSSKGTNTARGDGNESMQFH
jgi:hypothetical protein